MLKANNEKVVAFAGHRYEWHCIGVENKLPEVLEDLINKGYTIFYDGHYGAFDEKCAHAALQLKHKYPHIKLIRILTYYNLCNIALFIAFTNQFAIAKPTIKSWSHRLNKHQFCLNISSLHSDKTFDNIITIKKDMICHRAMMVQYFQK